MTKFKIEASVELRDANLCLGCPFLEYAGGGINECTATRERWTNNAFIRPSFCPLKEVANER